MEEFLESLRNDHSDFDKGSLEDLVKKVNPIVLFKRWLNEAVENKCEEPNAMAISTVDMNGMPSSRYVYLKEMDDKGLVFYTNYNSHKGHDLTKNPHISVLFFWREMSRQIRVQGIVEKVPTELSDEYFNSRPRESQIGAWASQQSEIILDRKTLEDKVIQLTKEFEGKEVPRPEYWGGYYIKPIYFEFWQGRESRLHDRICFEKKHIEDTQWNVYRRNP
ncbi:MAG: pyridoxamine 5'-phosphate oxidase [Brumimicrobium sp.]|nr:pyridoxamine 5'-phosphate oxidase [Brumimicrobium sp.]